MASQEAGRPAGFADSGRAQATRRPADPFFESSNGKRMTETKDSADKTLHASPRKPLSLQRTVESGHVRQNFSHGRSKSVVVEKRKTRKLVTPGHEQEPAPAATAPATQSEPRPASPPQRASSPHRADASRGGAPISQAERDARAAALAANRVREQEERERAAAADRERAEQSRLAVVEAAAAAAAPAATEAPAAAAAARYVPAQILSPARRIRTYSVPVFSHARRMFSETSPANGWVASAARR